MSETELTESETELITEPEEIMKKIMEIDYFLPAFLDCLDAQGIAEGSWKTTPVTQMDIDSLIIFAKALEAYYQARHNHM